MKKIVLTVAASVACVAAFAQGKISFQTDSVHLAYYDSTAGALAGTAVYSGNMPAGDNMVADLYMGTSSSALFLYSSSTFSATPGKWSALSVAANANVSTGASAIPGGTVVFVLAQVRDTNGVASSTLSGTQIQDGALAMGTAAGNKYIGWSQEFTFTLGSSVTYPFMYTATSWSQGSQDLSAYGAGNKGAIGVSAVPEPATFALAGLGAAAMLIFRRRK
jgi:hypothetical protein